VNEFGVSVLSNMPDVKFHTLEDFDTLVLATAGLWDVMTEHEICNVITQSKSPLIKSNRSHAEELCVLASNKYVVSNEQAEDISCIVLR